MFFILIIINVWINLSLFVAIHFSDLINNSNSFVPPTYSAEKYAIDPKSKSPSLNDFPKWPPLKIFIYPENKYHTEECLYPPEMPLRYVNESGYWFQRMLEPTIHHQFLNSPLVTQNPEEADLFYVPHYSRMCSGLDGSNRWNNIPYYLSQTGNYFTRYSSVDHFIMHSVPHYGDKPADKSLNRTKSPMIGILDLKLSLLKKHPWLAARATIVPFVTMESSSYNFNQTLQFQRDISVFVAMSTSTNGLKASSARLRQRIEEQLSNIAKSEILLIDRKKYVTFKNALDHIPQKMESSNLCIVPAGDAPISKRFYDSISHLCIPFLLADYIILPYEDVFVDYEKCVKQLPSKEIRFLSKTIKSISKHEIEKLRNYLFQVKELFTWNYKQKPVAGQALWALSWTLYDKIQMLKPYENNELTGYDSDPPFSFTSD